MCKFIFSKYGINPDEICQIVTTRYKSLSIFNHQGELIAEVKEDDPKELFSIKLSFWDDLVVYEADPRTFIWTDSDDIIRTSYIARMEHIPDRGIAFYNGNGQQILWFEEFLNDYALDIIEQIQQRPELPEEYWTAGMDSFICELDEFSIYPIDWHPITV